MTTSVYPIHKGINRPIVFRGLQAQYILYAGGILIGDLLLFAILYISGISSWICLSLAIILAIVGIGTAYRLSHRYGEFGLLKKKAARRLPKFLRSPSRNTFIHLKKN